MTGDLSHGGALDQMRLVYPNAPQPWVDLSTGINPWPYPNTDVTQRHLAHLPTLEMYRACRDAMAASIGATPEALLLSPGSELAIRLLPDVLRARRVVVLTPTYADHETSWQRAGAEIVRAEDPLEYADWADAIVICHPNNPDGRLFELDALEEVRKKLTARGGWLIVDEAYADLTPDLSLAAKGGEDGLIILRSFGKFYGLAGVRLGGVLAPPLVRKAISERLGVWPVSGSALEIGARAYADRTWQKDARKRLSSATSQLNKSLKEQELNLVGGTDLFCLIEMGDAHIVFHRLAKSGVYVRRFDWSQTHLRIGVPASEKAQERLLRALIL